MKTIFTRILAIVAVLTAPIFAHAQTETDNAPAPETASADGGDAGRAIPLLTPAQLDELLGPIALYPDALIALILPASTMPTDLVLASRYIVSGGDKTKVDDQPWDESVRSLAHYPDVVKWMDEKLSWSIMVGDAFTAQPVDVMQSIQRLRAKARAAGTLSDSEQQKVVEEDGNIRIVPARPEVIYVPYYDPQVVYVERAPYWGWGVSVISYPWCYPTGIWLSYDCDWYNHHVWVVNSHYRHHWYHDHEWWRPTPRHGGYHRDHDRDNGFGHAWMPRHDRRRNDHRDTWRDRTVVVRDGRRDVPDARSGGRDDWRERIERRSTTPGDRTRDTGRRDVVNTPTAPEQPRTDRGDHRSGVAPRVDRPNNGRSPANPPAVVRSPESPRRAPNVSGRNSDDRGNVTVVSPPPRTSAPSTGRWIDRATNPGAAPRSPAPQVNTSNPRPSPRVAPAPRVAPTPSASPAPQRNSSQVVRIPVPGAGSRQVTVNSAPAPQRAPQASAPRQESRGGREVRGGGDTRVERRRSNDN